MNSYRARLVTAFGVLLTLGLAAPAQELKTRRVTVPGTNPPVTLVFSHCPAGKVKVGDPSAAAPEADVGTFYIAQTELTFGQLRAILGPAAVERVKKQIEEHRGVLFLPDDTLTGDALKAELKRVENYKNLFVPGKGDDFPVFCLSIDEVVAICKELRTRTMNDPARLQRAVADPLGELEADDFRLPTYAQWQYACRGPNPAEHPHLGVWAPLETIKDANRFKARWKDELKCNDDFTGTQDQLMRVSRLTNADLRQDADKFLLDYINAVLKPAPGSERRAVDFLCELAPVGKSQPNGWGLFDMHDNVSEWVLWADTPAQYNLFWQDLLKSGAKSVNDQPRLFLSGGYFLDPVNGANAFRKFVSWGGPLLDEKKPNPAATKYLDEKSKEYMLESCPGVRLVIVPGLADDWFVLFRKAWMPNGAKPVDAAKQAVILQRVTQVFDQNLPAEHAARDVVSFYKALASDGSAAVEEWKKVHAKMSPQTPAKTQEDDKAYLDVLSGLVESDKKKP